MQLTEAKRWNVTYGFGLEAQTGTPQPAMISEASCIQLGLTRATSYSQEGKAGVSPRVSLDVSRINLRGTEDSLTLHSAYGLLEQVAILTLQNPHLYGSQEFVGGDLGWLLEHSGHHDVYSRRRCRETFGVTQRSQLTGHVYLRLSVPAGGGGSEQPAGFGGPDSAAVAAGACGRPGDYVVSRYAVARSAGCGEGIVLDGADVCGVVEVRLADGLLEDGWIERDVLPVWQAEVCVCAEYADWI